MRFLVRFKRVFCLASVLLMFVTLIGVSTASAEKVGVLFFGTGMDEDYKPDWLVGYFDHLFPVFEPGFYAGGDIEGGDCYTLIHFANEDEAEICNVAEGTPIDVFCNVYTNEAEYPVHTVMNHLDWSVIPPIPDESFATTCYDGDYANIFYFMGHSTIRPSNGNEIAGAHVDDPNAAGIGVSDFVEQALWARMEQMAVHFPGHKSPYREQWLKWMYGNEIPPAYGSWETSATEPTNIKDELQAAILADPEIPEGTELVFRNGWESYLENKDIYRNDAYIVDSTETAIEELINVENVDRIIVFSNGSTPSNLTNWGPEWLDKDGNGISRIADKTYRDCVEDLSDAYGPTTQADLDTLVANKPWDQYYAPFPDINHLVEKISGNAGKNVDLTFTETYGVKPEYDEGFLEIVKYTLDTKNGGIPNNSSVKVVLAHHGFYGGHKGGFWCDNYFTSAEEQVERVAATIADYYSTQTSRTFPAERGGFSVVAAPNEFSQPGEGGFFDQPTAEKPFGDDQGAGEIIDQSINGKYVNELGNVVDNGNGNFDYVIVVPISWDGENIDTVLHLRADTMGNIDDTGTIQNQTAWTRQHDDQSGEEYLAETAFDEEFYTIRSYDASGWCSVAASGEEVCKGTTIDPTTIIVTGSLLSTTGASEARDKFTDAAVAVISDAIKDPNVGGGVVPTDQAPVITQEPTTFPDDQSLSTDPAAPTVVTAQNLIYWRFSDNELDCTGITADWQYRAAGSSDPMTVEAATVFQVGEGAFTFNVGQLGTGTYEFQAVLTDCAGNVTTSSLLYITVDMPPQIVGPLTSFDSGEVLSTDSANPTSLIYWDFVMWIPEDDEVCGDIEVGYNYRELGSTDEMIFNLIGTEENTGLYNGEGAITTHLYMIDTFTDYEIQAVVTDCSGQTVVTDSYYFTKTGQ
jgi:hypothetical protein